MNLQPLIERATDTLTYLAAVKKLIEDKRGDKLDMLPYEVSGCSTSLSRTSARFTTSW